MLFASLPVSSVLALAIVVLLANTVLQVVQPFSNVDFFGGGRGAIVSLSWSSCLTGVCVGSVWALSKLFTEKQSQLPLLSIVK